MKSAYSHWERFWFAPMETSTVALYRIALGLLVLGWILSLSPSLLAFYSTNGLLPDQPDYWGPWGWGLFTWFESDVAVVFTYFAMLAACLFVIVGFRTRLAALVLFVCLVSFGRRNPWVLNSGDLLVRCLAFYLVLMPAGAALSVDRWLNRGKELWTFPARSIWPLRLVQIQLSIVYLVAVWDKLRGSTWNDGTAVSYAMRIGDLERFPVPAFVTDSVTISNLLTFGTLAIELSVGILVWNRFLRPWVLLLGVSLHLGIDYAVRVGFFSYAVLVAYVAFVPPDTARRLILASRDRLAGLSLPRRVLPVRRSE